MRALLKLSFFLLFIHGPTHAAQVFFSDTINVKNTNPIAMLLSLPQANYFVEKSPESATIRTDLELTNYISASDNSEQKLLIDGETWRVRNRVSYQYNQLIQVHLDTSWIKHTGGVSDRFIFHFHDVLGLPQNGRSDERHDQLLWRLTLDDEELLRLDNEESYWGDTEVSFSWKPHLNSNIQLTSKLKLPTGRFSKQTGSNRPDFSVSVSQQNPNWFRDRSIFSETPLALWYGAGLGYVGQIDELDELSQYPISLSVRGGFAWQVLPFWQLKTQIDSHSPLFDSEARELGWIPLQISFESLFQISQDMALNFMISEDLRPRSVPDVILSTGLEITF